MAEFTGMFPVNKKFDDLIRSTYQYSISFDLPTFFIACIMVTLFFCILYQILNGLFFWFLVEMRPSRHDLEEGTGQAHGGAGGGASAAGPSSSHHRVTIFQALVDGNLQAWTVVEAFEGDFDEKRGKRLRALKKLPPLVNYGSHDAQRGCDDCAICLEDFKVGQFCQVFPVCSHIFHSDCIDRWLQKKSTCPICRSCIYI